MISTQFFVFVTLLLARGPDQNGGVAFLEMLAMTLFLSYHPLTIVVLQTTELDSTARTHLISCTKKRNGREIKIYR